MCVCVCICEDRAESELNPGCVWSMQIRGGWLVTSEIISMSVCSAFYRCSRDPIPFFVCMANSLLTEQSTKSSFFLCVCVCVMPQMLFLRSPTHLGVGGTGGFSIRQSWPPIFSCVCVMFMCQVVLWTCMWRPLRQPSLRWQSTCFLRQSNSLTWNSPSGLGWLVSESRGCACLHLLPWAHRHIYSTSYFTWALRFTLRPPGLHGKPFPKPSLQPTEEVFCDLLNVSVPGTSLPSLASIRFSCSNSLSLSLTHAVVACLSPCLSAHDIQHVSSTGCTSTQQPKMTLVQNDF